MIENLIDRESVVIVSGLPRSGTSMMMQILEAGGVPVLSDRIRRADVDNPRGYYEFEPVKKTREDASWIADARGSVVKMVYALLYDLSDDYRYRVVFMDRKLDEVVASQNTMLARHGKSSVQIDDRKMIEMFERQLAAVRSWLERKRNFEVLYVSYNGLLADPSSQLERIRSFLGDLDIEGMRRVIDPALYRNRG
jgi:hypothetical protein